MLGKYQKKNKICLKRFFIRTLEFKEAKCGSKCAAHGVIPWTVNKSIYTNFAVLQNMVRGLKTFQKCFNVVSFVRD